MLKVVKIEEQDQWDKIIGENPEIYDKWQYLSAFKKLNDGQPILIYKDFDYGTIYNVIMKRDIASLKYFKDKIPDSKYYDIVTPYGYGGIMVTGSIGINELKKYYKEYEKLCINENVISEFVRMNPLKDNYKYYESQNYYVFKNSKIIYMQLDSAQQVWENLKSVCRNRIRKAKKLGLIVKSGFNEELMNSFKKIYIETMKRDNAEDYYFFNQDFFKDIIINMKGYAKIYITYLNENPIDAVLTIFSGSNAYYHLGGTLSEYMNLGAHNLSLYEAAIDSMNMGFKKFNLGGRLWRR